MISSDKYIRSVLGKGFQSFLQAAALVTAAIALSSYYFQFFIDALLAAICLPLIGLAWLLTRAGSIYGVLLIVIVAVVGSSWSINPSTLYVGPAVSIFLVIAPLIATRFIDPQAGIWALFMQLFALMFALVIKEIPPGAAVRYGFFAFLDLSIITGAFIISSNILRRALIRSYEDEQELQRMYDNVLSGWSHALELRNKETQGHTDRVTRLTLLIASAIGMEDDKLPDIRRGALLHDIGKTGIPDSILLKPGPLSSIEKDIMKLHPTYAYQWLRPFQRFGQALDIPYCHHERWDGSGYPRGLRGRDIPISARIFAIADVYDALVSTRPYRPALPREEALNYIVERSGKDFDPELVQVFLKEEEKLYNQTNDDIY
jgi:hypothetical protein